MSCVPGTIAGSVHWPFVLGRWRLVQKPSLRRKIWPFWARYIVPGSTIDGRVAVGMYTVASVGILAFREAMRRFTPNPKPPISASRTTTVIALLIVPPQTAGKNL